MSNPKWHIYMYILYVNAWFVIGMCASLHIQYGIGLRMYIAYTLQYTCTFIYVKLYFKEKL